MPSGELSSGFENLRCPGQEPLPERSRREGRGVREDEIDVDGVRRELDVIRRPVRSSAGRGTGSYRPPRRPDLPSWRILGIRRYP